MLEKRFEPDHAQRVQSGNAVQNGTGPAHFATTRWSLILSQRTSGDGQCSARGALAQLCQIYWRPIFAFICRHGHPAADAQDLTQDFFVLILEGNLLQSADPGRGRFRSLLLKSLNNFLIDADIKRKRRKRGGSIQFVSWQEWMAEAPSQLSISAHALESCPADTLFDLRWAATVAEQALRRLREECESRGRRRVYDVLSDYLTADRTEISYRHLSTVLGVAEISVKRLMHEFRARYRMFLREEIENTVENGADVDDEIRYLCSALSAAAA